MKHSKTDYRGGNAHVLSTPAFELAVTTDVGPRVVSLRSTKGKAGNLFLSLDAKTEQRLNGYLLRGGHRLWHSPEHVVRSYQPDDDPLAVKPLKNGIALAQPTEAKTGIQKAIKIEVLGSRTIKLTHALTNDGLWAIETAAWGLTMMRAGGYGVLPLLPKGDHKAGDLLPSYSFVPWTYTDLSLPVWDLHRDFVGIDVPKATAPQKFGITNYPGWSAYWVDGTTFVKYAPVLSGAGIVYPDFGCAFETFTNGTMIEFETLSPLTRLEPGAFVEHVEHWTLLDGLARPDNDAAFAKLAAEVGKWIKTLKK
ncbi:hypothetical protein Ga0100231_010150 [Opitutaceae bacterium TAV4]|uniref:hypothetical protein n=1 Tax=Geminisphaera colitermitum TaxID=1148786 RepID=UPI0001964D8A|nr:hypothetical protein [Geminisphaera colitermitum]RRJ94645.1 hypothetical protein Ga0100231_010150 [Opitutaceae bacterium TAV4]RRJ98713.1 hypothetical protein Ga0100230_010260 [Opitutaceae bacterium TAV3]